MLMPLFVVVALFRSYELLRVFDIVYGLTGGGPGRATETLSFHIFNEHLEANHTPDFQHDQRGMANLASLTQFTFGIPTNPMSQFTTPKP